MLTIMDVRLLHDDQSKPSADGYFPLGLFIEELKKLADELEVAAMSEVFDESPYPIKLKFEQDPITGTELEAKVVQQQ